ncbi:MAG: hypothetical protein U1F68_14830 [Gammaproteobacteria bacterium]
MIATTPNAVPLPMSSASYVVIDLETTDAPAEAITDALARWKPGGNVKDPEKIAAQRLEAAANIRDKSALLDAAPIVCVAMQTEAAKIVLNGMDGEHYAIDQWQCLGCGHELALLKALRGLLDYYTGPDTVMVGHNLVRFDLPKLRNRFLFHGLRLPAILQPAMAGDDGPRVFDTMRRFRFYSQEHSDALYVTLDTVAASFGVPRPKQVMTGADVPRLHRDGQHHAILTYCCLDAATTARIYSLMSGSAADLE